jgi:hypothetical protein
MRFLDSMAPNWNISLCHYRSQGGDVGRIVIGLQVPPEEMSDFAQFLATLGYRYWDESRTRLQTVPGLTARDGVVCVTMPFEIPIPP